MDHLRSTAKWVITVFAGIGAVLTAGLQLSSIGKLEWDDARFWIAAIGLALAFGLVALIIWITSAVLTAGEVNFREIAEREDKQQPDYRDADLKLIHQQRLFEPEYASAGALWDSYTDALNTIRDATRRIETADPNDPNYESLIAQWGQDLSDAENARYRAEGVMDRTYEVLRYKRTQSAFDGFKRWIIPLVFLVALAVTAFAWGANPPEPEPTATTVEFRLPTLARLDLNTDGEELWGSSIGQACAVSPDIQVIVLQIVEARYDVVTLPGGEAECRLARFTVEQGQTGVVQPLE